MRNIARWSGNYLVSGNRILIDSEGARQELSLKRAGAVKTPEFALERLGGKTEGGEPPVEESESWLMNLVFGDRDEPESGGR